MRHNPITRRAFLGCLSAALAWPTPAPALEAPGIEQDVDDWTVGFIPDRPFDIPVADLNRIDPRYHRQLVGYDGPERPGTIVVDTDRRFLFLVQPDETALRYGIGVGRVGFSWSGQAQIRRRAVWPTWRPPVEMLRRRPDLPTVMPGGLDNPLGARALYLYQGNRDTLYRIHGTNEPWSIGEAVSSGCIRLLNQDIYDLYHRVSLGATVLVRRHGRRGRPDPMPEFEAEEPFYEGAY